MSAPEEHVEIPKTKRQPWIVRYAGTLGFIAAVVVLYEIATDLTGTLDKVFFPGLSVIFTKMIASSSQLLDCLVSSLSLLIPAYALALVTGIGLGVLIGSHPAVKRNASPLIFALSPIPPSILTPYLITVMPTFYLSSVAVIFIGCFWPILSGTINGIATTKAEYIDNAEVMELKGFKKLWHVTLPAASSHILAGADMALTFSFILLVIAEMLATDSGLGYFVQYYADFSDYGRVLGGLLYMMAVVVVIKLIFEFVKRRILYWELEGEQD